MVDTKDTIYEDLSMFIDESGSITKTNMSFNRYFIIAILFTRKYGRIKRYFEKGIASLIQDEKYKEMLKNNGEIKGSKLSETKKKPKLATTTSSGGLLLALIRAVCVLA